MKKILAIFGLVMLVVLPAAAQITDHKPSKRHLDSKTIKINQTGVMTNAQIAQLRAILQGNTKLLSSPFYDEWFREEILGPAPGELTSRQILKRLAAQGSWSFMEVKHRDPSRRPNYFLVNKRLRERIEFGVVMHAEYPVIIIYDNMKAPPNKAELFFRNLLGRQSWRRVLRSSDRYTNYQLLALDGLRS